MYDRTDKSEQSLQNHSGEAHDSLESFRFHPRRMLVLKLKAISMQDLNLFVTFAQILFTT
jgi:hypothetical protein